MYFKLLGKGKYLSALWLAVRGMDIFLWSCVNGSSNVSAQDLRDPVKLESYISQNLTGVWIVSASKNCGFYNKSKWHDVIQMFQCLFCRWCSDTEYRER